MTTPFASLIAPILQLNELQVAATIRLLDDKATIPFIARYRKEKTGSLDEVAISQIQTEYVRLQNLVERKETMIHTIEEQGKLTEALRNRIDACWNAVELEDIYLPYKPHRKTRADIAIEHGLEPLANLLMEQSGRVRPEEAARAYIRKEVPNVEEALQQARDIIAQRIAEDEKARNAIRREFSYSALLTTKAVKDKADTVEAQNYRDYFALSEPLKRIPSHRMLAIRRAVNEGYIRMDISPDREKALDKLAYLYLRAKNDCAYQVELAMEDSYKRLLRPSIETEFAAEAKLKADTEAVRIFADNLRQLLMESPLGQKRVLALDPGFRTGCKTVVLTPEGDLVMHDVVYLHQMEAPKHIAQWVKQYQIEAIAIGNGTASRETNQMVEQALQGLNNPPLVFTVSENGASVYSASQIARQEFPNEDVTVRGAVSIGRRLMDPLAELVKIDPKSIGVGQYQHDVDQTMLRDSLSQTVESVVNAVGVNVNTASQYLLTYISGLGSTLAQNIVSYRAANGPFASRKELMKVPKMGAKTFQQAAGFLRVAGADNPLDNSAVHPESYAIVEQMAKDMNCQVSDLMSQAQLRQQIDLKRYITEDIGLPTLTDILHELEKPGRDPRAEKEVFRFEETVKTIDDLQPGMILPGIVTNISTFGAFVDLGVHKDGLIHVSEVSDRRVKSPSEVLKLHQHVRVRVVDIDRQRQRIQLSLRNINNQ